MTALANCEGDPDCTTMFMCVNANCAGASSYPNFTSCVTGCATNNHVGASGWASYHGCVCQTCGAGCPNQCQ
jgi:hypothetical protein